MNQRLAENERIDETLSLSDIGRLLCAHKKLLIGLPLVFSVLAASGAALIKPQWEAVSVVQIGQVWQVAAPIEAPVRAVERIRLQSFKTTVLTDLGMSSDDADPFARLYSDSLKVKVLPNTDLIELKIRAHSRQDAQRWAEATVKRLQFAHQKLADPMIARLQQQLDQVKKQIQLIREEKERLLKNSELKSEIGPGNRFAESVLLSNFLLQKDAELRLIETQRLALEEQLDPAKTYPTSLLEKVHVPLKPAYPRRALTIVLAGLTGLFFGVMGAFLLNALRADKLPPTSQPL